MEIHGHRGSRGTHPENTLPAFQEAVDCGAAFLELDLQMTADDIPMVFHDPEVSARLCARRDGRPLAVPVPVRALKAAELADFECGSVRQSRFPDQRLSPGAAIPRFDEVLAWARTNRIGLNVELKSEISGTLPPPDPDRYADIVLGAIRRHGLLDRVRLQSFDFEPLRRIRSREKGAILACLFEERRDFIAETIAIGAQIVAPFFEFVTREFIAECHRHALRVVPWTVNESRQWQELVSWGIDGIITDYPRRLQETLPALTRAGK